MAAPFAYLGNGYATPGGSVIDTATNKLIGTFAGSRETQGVAVSPHGKRVYATVQGAYGFSGFVEVLDTVSNAL